MCDHKISYESSEELIAFLNNRNERCKSELYTQRGIMSNNSVFVSSVNNELAKTDTVDPQSVSSLSEAWIKLQAYINTTKRSQKGDRYFFRGQINKNWPLIPSITRELINEFGSLSLDKINHMIFRDNISQYEVHRFNCFIDYIKKNDEYDKMEKEPYKLPSSNDSNWWAIMQHHDQFKTRLLDITSNFLVALYFACAEWNPKGKTDSEPEDGRVYILRKNVEFITLDDFGITNAFSKLTKDNVIFFIKPTSLHPRIVKQESYFITSKNLTEDMTLNSDYSLIVKNTSKSSILQELDYLGINEEHLKKHWRY